MRIVKHPAISHGMTGLVGEISQVSQVMTTPRRFPRATAQTRTGCTRSSSGSGKRTVVAPPGIAVLVTLGMNEQRAAALFAFDFNHLLLQSLSLGCVVAEAFHVSILARSLSCWGPVQASWQCWQRAMGGCSLCSMVRARAGVRMVSPSSLSLCAVLWPQCGQGCLR